MYTHIIHACGYIGYIHSVHAYGFEIILNILVFKNKSCKKGLLIQVEIALKMRIISAHLKGNFKYAFDLNGGLG